MTDLHVILGNQLFPIKYIRKIKPNIIFMREDLGLCTYQKHHKHKLILFLSAMRSYRDELHSDGINIEYQKLYIDSDTYIDSLIKFIKQKKIKNISIWSIEDKPFREKFLENIENHVERIKEIVSPMFLTKKSDFLEMCPTRKKPKYKMTDFYINQRKRLNILLTSGKPTGGKWTYDNENRKKISKDIKPPSLLTYRHTAHTKEVIKMVSEKFKDHYGDANDFNYPTTRKQALNNLDCFINDRFKNFGDYEDSVDQRSHLWFHSNLSSSLNIGLITPKEILIKISNIKKVPINSYEGFIRQIIGWREFMRCIYHYESDVMEKSNFFKHRRKLKGSWYTGDTGLDPLDVSIKSTIKHAYSHHIERLMIQINLMNLCEIEPKNAYNWFMELYIDSSDWVMMPNVYSMGLFADGGIIATKPYICGSNYILKMMDFKKGDWCDIFDGLYWRFIDKNRDFFKTNPRLNMMVSLFDKMKRERKENILTKANQFLKDHTK
tara:strand:- start:128 stop:1606 length:1479 start_codon:yes stop_codon:yes gene_type:complete